MIDYAMSFIRPTNTKSALTSSFVSLVASNLGAKSVATATLLLTGLMSLPHNQAAKTITQALMDLMMPERVSQIVHAPVKKTIELAKNTITEEIVIRKKNQLNLRSLEKEYTCVFRGKVTCGGRPCNSADLKVHVAFKESTDRVKSINVEPDGTYTASFLVRAVMNEHVDWWIVADSPDSASKQIQGRQILMDETTVTIDEPIGLL